MARPVPLIFGVGERAGEVRIQSVDDAFLYVNLLLSGAPDRGGGVGGWEVSERVLRPPADWWRAQPKSTISLPCMLDIHEQEGPSLETRLKRLYAMGQPRGDDPPPPVWLVGDVPTARTQWWRIDDISLGERIFRTNPLGHLRRQELTVQLTEFVEATGVPKVTVRRTRDSKGRRRVRTIRARKGDTLRRIAVRELGSASAWTDLRSWNKKLRRVDPDAPLRAGSQITLK
jgi:hypothetical protein